MTEPSDTPRTDAADAAFRAFDGYHNLEGMALAMRQLERELAAKDAELDRHKRMSESGESLSDALDMRERIIELEAEIEEAHDRIKLLEIRKMNDVISFTDTHDKLRSEYKQLLTRIHNFDRTISAVATALGGVCCGGVDVDGPGSTRDVLVGAIEKLKAGTVPKPWKLEPLELKSVVNLRYEIEQLRSELSESRAQVARCAHALKQTAAYLRGEPWYPTGGDGLMNYIDELAASLPDQAKRDAEVLRAAEDVCANQTGEMTHALMRLCQAVRGDKV